MRHLHLRALACAGIVILLQLLCPRPAGAAFDAFLKIEGVDGESADERHKNWIDVESITQSRSRQGTTNTFQPIILNKRIDKSTPRLLHAIARGTNFPTVTLHCVEISRARAMFYELRLRNVQISGGQSSGDTSSSLPMETFSLNFASVEGTYTEMDVTGVPARSISSYWDLARNTGAVSTNLLLRMLYGRSRTGQFVVQWEGRAGETYNLRSSPAVTGDFPVLQTHTAASDGSQTITLSPTLPSLFLRLEKAQ